MKKGRRIIARILAFLGITILLAVLAVIGIVTILFKGPSDTASDLLALSLKETSALKWVPELYFSDDEMKAILERNTVVITEDVTDTSLIEVSNNNEKQKAIEIIDVSGATYKGKVMLVKDPSTVFVGAKGEFDGSGGLTAINICNRYNGVAAINGGGFADGGGMGNGGTPEGFVISQGKHLYGGLSTKYITIGFTNDNKLIVGNMTGQEAINKGMRDAVCVMGIYAPLLIVNGEPQEVKGYGGGLNPRTAIGQKEDGTIILAVIDGRQANSLGASFSDMIRIMQDYGAVNASCLDGGSSTQMSYMGEVLNNPYSLRGAREISTAIVVK